MNTYRCQCSRAVRGPPLCDQVHTSGNVRSYRDLGRLSGTGSASGSATEAAPGCVFVRLPAQPGVLSLGASLALDWDRGGEPVCQSERGPLKAVRTVPGSGE